MNREKNIPVGVSNRHIHLSQTDLEALFGRGHRLGRYRTISQTGQFAAKETLDAQGPEGSIKNIRVVGPTRGRTQLEIAPSDARKLGIAPPVRYSGDLDGSACIEIIGPHGKLHLSEGVIIPQRHIHMSRKDANGFGVSDRDRVIVAPANPPKFDPQNETRHMVFDNVLIRVDPLFVLDFHLDVDEANASGLKNGDRVKIVGFSSINAQTPRTGLVTENDVRRAILAKTKILLTSHAKVTPAAKDLGREFSVFEK